MIGSIISSIVIGGAGFIVSGRYLVKKSVLFVYKYYQVPCPPGSVTDVALLAVRYDNIIDKLIANYPSLSKYPRPVVCVNANSDIAYYRPRDNTVNLSQQIIDGEPIYAVVTDRTGSQLKFPISSDYVIAHELAHWADKFVDKSDISILEWLDHREHGRTFSNIFKSLGYNISLKEHLKATDKVAYDELISFGAKAAPVPHVHSD